jgi:AcrR family transcriptional regulator
VRARKFACTHYDEPVTSLREQKKQATREALRAAALALALRKGPENVRVDEIAQAAGVSPRTYNNYFPSREHAIVAAVTEAALPGLAPDVPLADAVIEAVVRHYTDPGERAAEAMLMITTNPALRARYAETAADLDGPLTAALTARGIDSRTAEVLAAAVTAAARLALRRWLRPAGPSELVVVRGALPELIRAALEPLRPSLERA